MAPLVRIALSRLFAASVLLVLPGCEGAGVGDPCVPEDEYHAFFSGYALGEVNLESRSFQCETRVCLVNHFQGRVSCPYGQSLAGGASPRCRIPGTASTRDAIRVDVAPNLTNRRDVDAVYCSCRCNGPNLLARYCTCPTGFTCTELLRDIGVGGAELSGSYCIKEGTAFDSTEFVPGPPCDATKGNCGAEGER